MTQAQIEKVEKLKEDPRTFNQITAMMEVVNEAFRNNMSAYIKLVQMDCMKIFDANCEADGVGGDRIAFSRGILDPILNQINIDLNNQIMNQFADVRSHLGKNLGE